MTSESSPGRSDRTALFSDLPTMKLILQQVDQLQNAVDDDILERLSEENGLLIESLEGGRQRLVSLSRLFQEAFEGYVVLNHYLTKFDNDMRTVGRDFDIPIVQCEITGESVYGGSNRGSPLKNPT
jgi:hypothetical protein